MNFTIRIDLPRKWWEVLSNYGPEDVMVHGVVVMDETVSRTDDFAPGYPGMLYLNGIRNADGSFADNLHKLQERQEEGAI